MTRDQVVAVTAPFPGVQQWFRHGDEEEYWTLVPLDEDGIDRRDLEGYDVLLLGAWHPRYRDVLIHASRNLDADVYIAWSSSPYETELQPQEIKHLASFRSGWVADHVDGYALLNEAWLPWFEDTWSLPAPVHVDEDLPPPRPRGERDGLGFYVPPSPKKNILNQLIAVKHLQTTPPDGFAAEDLHLYHNLDPYTDLLDAYGVNHTHQGWVPDRTEHYRRLGARLVCLHASMSESWGYGAVDAMQVGTPVMGSDALDWLPTGWRVVNREDPHVIGGQLRDLLKEWPKADQSPRDVLRDVAEEQRSRTLKALDTVLPA